MKADVVFGLENAGWPALLLDETSTICRANTTAVTAFGAALAGGSPRLATIWAGENSSTPEQFLADWGRSPASKVTLKLRGKGGNTVHYDVTICSFIRDAQRFYVLQLLPHSAAPSPTTQVKASEPAAPASHPSSAVEVEDGTQRLECALQLARTVALDFNNALTSVLGHASLLLSSAEPNHPWRSSLLEIEKSTARAAEVADELAMFSRQEHVDHQNPGNLNLVLQHAVDAFRQQPAAAAAAWTLQLERNVYPVQVQEAKLQQAFIRVLENAAEALPGSGRISVLTRNLDLREPSHDGPVRLPAGSHVCVEISDNGCGISSEVLPRIFEPFFTTKDGESHRGLGLAWVYGVVTNHGGGVAVSSQPGAGTSVRLYFPADKRTFEAAVSPAELKGDQTILVVDDEDLLLTMNQAILSTYGYRVLTASSGQKALDILTRPGSAVDLVITDLLMPGMSGRELSEHIHRLKPALPVLPVLWTSGYAHPSFEENGTSFLQKPFTTQQLLLKVKEVLARGSSTPVEQSIG